MEFLYIKMDRLILLKGYEMAQRGEIVTLARSISKHGVLVPITVKRILHTDRFEVISGVKRFYACRMTGEKYIPSYVIDTPQQLARLIIKKGDQKDMFEEAELIRDAMLSEGMNAEELSQASGYTEKEIVSSLRLSKMGEFEREMVRKNGILMESVCEIAAFDDICKRTELLSETVRSRLTPSEVRELCVAELKGKRARRHPKAPRLKDMKLFDNTINRAISLLNSSGIKANVSSGQTEGVVEYKIKIER